MKANELTSKDLMIWDWLQDSFGNIGQVYRLDPGRVHLRLLQERPQDDEYIVHDIEPIPLTPEILEKNGFKKDFELKGCYWRPDCRKYCIVKEIETWYFAFRHMGGGHICISECNYVHQLQHALRLCGVNKEIEL